MARDAGATPKVWMARSSGVTKIKGVLYRYYVGQTVPADSPLIKAMPDRFELVDMTRTGVVIGPGADTPILS